VADERVLDPGNFFHEGLVFPAQALVTDLKLHLGFLEFMKPHLFLLTTLGRGEPVSLKEFSALGATATTAAACRLLLWGGSTGFGLSFLDWFWRIWVFEFEGGLDPRRNKLGTLFYIWRWRS
jgi:uncharacterized membrane protein